MPLLNPPLPELNQTDVRLYYDDNPELYSEIFGAYLIEIIFQPGYKLISPMPAQNTSPYGLSYLIESFELTTMFFEPGYQEPTQVLVLGTGFRPDYTEPPQDKFITIHFRELDENQLIESKTKVLFFVSARKKPKRINYLPSNPAG